jgi:hypothetical protein
VEVREGGDGKIVADAYFLFAVAILPPRVITVAILPPRVIMGITILQGQASCLNFFLIKKFFSHYGAIKGKHKKYIELI